MRHRRPSRPRADFSAQSHLRIGAIVRHRTPASPSIVRDNMVFVQG
jgi:hypothetical protein